MSGVCIVSCASDVAQFAVQIVATILGGRCCSGCQLQARLAFLVLLPLEVLAIRLRSGATNFAHFAVVQLLGLRLGLHARFSISMLASFLVVVVISARSTGRTVAGC